MKRQDATPDKRDMGRRPCAEGPYGRPFRLTPEADGDAFRTPTKATGRPAGSALRRGVPDSTGCARRKRMTNAARKPSSSSGIDSPALPPPAAPAPPATPPAMPPPALRATATCERVKHELCGRLEKMLRARAPLERASIMKGIKANHWNRVPQAVRAVEERYGPLPGSPLRDVVDHRQRLAHFLRHDCGADAEARLGMGADEYWLRYFEAAPFPKHPEQQFLRLEAALQAEQSLPPGRFPLPVKQVLERIYTTAGQFDKVLKIDGLVARAGVHTAQLVRAVLEKNLPAHLPPRPGRTARLKAFSAAHKVPIGALCSLPTDGFEERMLALVLEYGAEPLDAWKYELDDARGRGLAESPTPLI